MTAAEIVRHLVREGYRVSLNADGERLHIEPRLATELLRKRVLARKADIVAFLCELGAPAATAHAFVAMETTDDETVKELSVCIGCGIPWAMHGEPPRSAWKRVDDPNEVALIDAAAIVATAAVQTAGGPQ